MTVAPLTDRAGGAGTDLDELAVTTLRFLAVDAVEEANSAHPGLPLGAAPVAWVLWSRYLRHDPSCPTWPDRDRFGRSGPGPEVAVQLGLTASNIARAALEALGRGGGRARKRA
jgi:transketolase